MDIRVEFSIAVRKALCGCAFGLILIPALVAVRGQAAAPLGAFVAALCLTAALAGFCFLTYWIDSSRLKKPVPTLP
ncbi:MAG: hypothetical protein PVI01_04405 [Gemmatimonadales bacterium]|jgi:hypothetical protein